MNFKNPVIYSERLKFRFCFTLAVGVAAAPALLSVAAHPWLYSVNISARSRFDLPGETALLELARVESLKIYTGTFQTLMTPAKDWPHGVVLRDACLIGLSPKEADARAPTSVWTDRTIRRMFLDRIVPGEVRATYYESEATHEERKLSTDQALAIEFLRAMEPYRAPVIHREVRHFVLPESAEYRRRTGIKEIIGLAVEPTSLVAMGNRGKAENSPVALGPAVARAIREAGEGGVHFLTIPFIGATVEDGVDEDVYSVLLRSAIDSAENPRSLRALYVGAYADDETRRKALITAVNEAWQQVLVTLQSREGKPADAGWRLTSIMSVAAVLSLFLRKQRRKISIEATLKVSVAIVLLAKGLAETLMPIAATLGTGSPRIVLSLLIASCIVGWYLPRIAIVDAKAILKEEVSHQ